MKTDNKYEIIIIGGSYAGLSAALTVGRSLRKTLIIDSNKPCNRQTPHAHNFLGQDGKAPQEIITLAKEQIAKYPSIHFLNDITLEVKKIANGFSVLCQSNETFQAKKLIITTGIQDELPKIPGISECWGISVVHCPYCHGYEYRSKTTGIIANGDVAYHYAVLVSQLTKDIQIFTNGPANFTEEQTSKLHANNIQVFVQKIQQVNHIDGMLQSIQMMDQQEIKLQAIYLHAPFIQHSDIAQQLACEMTEQGHIKVNPFQKTSIEGVFACGDNASPMRSIANAVASGNMAGAAINGELAMEVF